MNVRTQEASQKKFANYQGLFFFTNNQKIYIKINSL